ncbi:MAG: hypothetical protein JO145_11865 [Acidobacteriaceae bacterium]|nr:hypothetical protein [Acidobacteriaceae bacterium]
MATLTVRNVPSAVVNSLKSLARRKRHSMEHEIREILRDYVAERGSVLMQIETAWSQQKRRPTAKEIDGWIAAGRK